MSGRFEGRAVIVTGAGSGIGREVARQFADEGALLSVADIDAAAGEETVSLISSSGGTAQLCVTDVSASDQVATMIDKTVTAYGRIDVLHNNAYWAPADTPMADTTEDQWAKTLGVTLTGMFLGCKFAIPHMVSAGKGAIINTASTAALVATPRFGAYMVAKSGVLGLTRSVAYDYGGSGIRCNTICPGMIRTPASERVLADPEKMRKQLERIVVGRAGEPSDIAQAVLFLASDDAAYITGQELVVDGGRLIA